MTTPLVLIDARGMRCPWPALRLARALREGAERVEVIADDPIAPGELAAVAATRGLDFQRLSEARFLIAAS